MRKIKTKHIIIALIVLIWFGQPLIELAWLFTKIGISIFIPIATVVIGFRTILWLGDKATNQTDEEWWEYVKFWNHDDED